MNKHYCKYCNKEFPVYARVPVFCNIKCQSKFYEINELKQKLKKSINEQQIDIFG
jgi:hypothetical protein